MGCTQSSAQVKAVAAAGACNGSAKPALPLPDDLVSLLPLDGPLSLDEFRARLLSTDGTQHALLERAGLSLRYAFVSFRGLYPEALDKANQDAVCAYRRFANDPEQAFFGVFDGHGVQGTACAQFAKDKARAARAGAPARSFRPAAAAPAAAAAAAATPAAALHRRASTTPAPEPCPTGAGRGARARRARGAAQVPANLVMDPAFGGAPEEAFAEAVLTTNDQLHASAVDDAMSGTTAVAALVRGRALHVANVGDSRAVLAERGAGGRAVAVPLSFDHTPFRRARGAARFLAAWLPDAMLGDERVCAGVRGARAQRV